MAEQPRGASTGAPALGIEAPVDPQLVVDVSDGVAGSTVIPSGDPNRAIGADPHDFTGLYIRHRSTFAQHARRFLNDQGDVDDVVQESFLRMFLAMPELETETQALSYGRRTITNLCIDRFRADARRPRLLDLDAIPDDVLAEDDDDPVVIAEDAAIVRQALAMLSPLHREALIRREIEEQSIPEIAAELDIPVESVKHVLHRARRSLRRALRDSPVAAAIGGSLAVILLVLAGGIPGLGRGSREGTERSVSGGPTAIGPLTPVAPGRDVPVPAGHGDAPAPAAPDAGASEGSTGAGSDAQPGSGALGPPVMAAGPGSAGSGTGAAPDVRRPGGELPAGTDSGSGVVQPDLGAPATAAPAAPSAPVPPAGPVDAAGPTGSGDGSAVPGNGPQAAPDAPVSPVSPVSPVLPTARRLSVTGDVSTLSEPQVEEQTRIGRGPRTVSRSLLRAETTRGTLILRQEVTTTNDQVTSVTVQPSLSTTSGAYTFAVEDLSLSQAVDADGGANLDVRMTLRRPDPSTLVAPVLTIDGLTVRLSYGADRLAVLAEHVVVDMGDTLLPASSPGDSVTAPTPANPLGPAPAAAPVAPVQPAAPVAPHQGPPLEAAQLSAVRPEDQPVAAVTAPEDAFSS